MDMLRLEGGPTRWRVGAPAPGALALGAKLGRFRVVCELGRGSFGVVYAVRDAWRREPGVYALKLLAADSGRVRREAELLRRVRHPNVVRLYGQGHWLGLPYLLMEYVEGVPLYDWAGAGNPTPREVGRMAVALARALGAIHEARGVHRDFKGGNVLVRPSGEPVVLDLGSSWLEDAPTLTRTSCLPPGTLMYRSPEAARFYLQAWSQPAAHYEATAADDWYALGVTLYRVLADSYPFNPHLPDPLMLLECAARVTPVPLAERNPRVPGSLAAIVMRLLVKEPGERFPEGATQVVQALEAALADGDSAWDAPVFEWYAAPSPQSQTTQEVAPLWPSLPGAESPRQADRALRAARVQAHGEQRRLCRRSPRPGDVSRADAAIPRFIPATPRGWKERAWGGLLGCVVLGAGVLWSFAGTRNADMDGRERSSLVDVAGGGATLDAAPLPAASFSPPRKEDPAMTNPMQPRESAVQPAVVRKSSTLKRCMAAAGVSFAACSGPQLRPDSAPCPKAALDSMDHLLLERNNKTGIILDVNFPDPSLQVVVVQDGSIVSRMIQPMGKLPVGTILYGRLWTGGDAKAVAGRYTEAQIPDGRRFPVCFVLGNDASGWTKVEGSKPGAALLPHFAGVTVVHRFD